MKRIFACQAKEAEESAGNPFLALPCELIDTFLTLNNLCATPRLQIIDLFTSLLRLHLVDRASYSRFESFRKHEVLGVLNKLSHTYATAIEWHYHRDSIPVWTKISRLALCHDSYRQTIDEFLEERPMIESRFVSFVMDSIKEYLHPSQYADMTVRMSHITRHYSLMTRTQQRLLAYHCAAMFKRNCKPRTMISRVTYSTCLSHIYAYDDQKRIIGDDDDDYLVGLHRDEKKKIDVRYLVPLSLPLVYTNNEMLYAVENTSQPFEETLDFMSSKTLGIVGCLAPVLDVGSLIKCIREADAFRLCLTESREAIISLKRGRKVV
jgi:hypothetical protein